MPSTSARLLVAATPLGNPGDLSPRAAAAIAEADLVLAEDTRRTGILCKTLDIDAARFTSLNEHNEAGRIPIVLDLLRQGKRVVLVSDAGTPLVSDPGYRLVSACREAGIEVSPLPGPSAITAALSACGLPPQPFAFLGFLPRSRGEAARVLQTFGETGATLVFFERKSRLCATLALAADILGERDACLARELTKTHEEFILGSLRELAELPEQKGELTVVVGPPAKDAAASEAEADAALAAEAEAGGKPREIAKRAARRCPGWSAKQLYARLTPTDKGDTR